MIIGGRIYKTMESDTLQSSLQSSGYDDRNIFGMKGDLLSFGRVVLFTKIAANIEAIVFMTNVEIFSAQLLL